MDIIGQLLQEQTPIYNRYLNGDFQVGADNLNPRREIEQSTLQDLDSLRLALYLRYKDQIKTGVTGDGLSGAATDLGLPYIDRTHVTSTVTMREGMAPTSTSSSLENDLYKMLNIVNSFLGGEPVTLDDLPFDICNDRGGGSGEAAAGSGTSGSTAGGATVTAGLVGADNTGTANAPSLGSAATASDLKCIMIELQMLQAIFQILKFIRQMLNLEQKALAILYPYIEFIQMVIACILNPGMRQQLIMSLVGQAMAYLISFLTGMISQWLGNLNLDCILSNSMATVQQIMGQITAVGDIGSSVGSFMNFNANLAGSASDINKSVADAQKGNYDALYKALGIPKDQQQETKTMSAGELFTAAFKKGIAVPINSVVGIASSVTGTTVGAVQGTGAALSKAAGTTVESTAKLVKAFFPGSDVMHY